jgi:hypothetical protein
MTVHREGSTVPQSGIYDVLHHGHSKPKHQVTCIKGKRFPPCRNCGEDVTFRLYEAAIHIEDDTLLKKGAWKSAGEEALSRPLPKG